MILLIYVAAVGVAVILGRQERRHRVEISWECDRRGVPVPPGRPKLNRAEAWLNIGLGILLAFFGYALLSMHLWDQSAFYFAGGLTLVVLGIRAMLRATG